MIDNAGPFLEAEIYAIYEALRAEFDEYNDGKVSNLSIFSSTFDKYLDELYSSPNATYILNNNIETFTVEIGDRWSYGIASDPFKLAAFRNAMKLRSKCLNNGDCTLNSSTFYNFSRLLLKNGEHTFGASLKKALDQIQNAPDYSTYYNNEFFKQLYSNNSVNNFTQMRKTWYEQRDYGLYYALDALKLSNNSHEIELYNDISNVWNGRLHNVSSPFDNGKNNMLSGRVCRL